MEGRCNSRGTAERGIGSIGSRASRPKGAWAGGKGDETMHGWQGRSVEAPQGTSHDGVESAVHWIHAVVASTAEVKRKQRENSSHASIGVVGGEAATQTALETRMASQRKHRPSAMAQQCVGLRVSNASNAEQTGTSQSWVAIGGALRRLGVRLFAPAPFFARPPPSYRPLPATLPRFFLPDHSSSSFSIPLPPSPSAPGLLLLIRCSFVSSHTRSTHLSRLFRTHCLAARPDASCFNISGRSPLATEQQAIHLDVPLTLRHQPTTHPQHNACPLQDGPARAGNGRLRLRYAAPDAPMQLTVLTLPQLPAAPRPPPSFRTRAMPPLWPRARPTPAASPSPPAPPTTSPSTASRCSRATSSSRTTPR
jgi:hypothetical protein